MATFPRSDHVRGRFGMASASDNPSKNVRFTPETPRNFSEGYRGTIDPTRSFAALGIAPMEYSRLLYAVFIGIVFFAEVPTPWTLGGAGIIVASTLYTLHRNALKKRQKASDGP